MKVERRPEPLNAAKHAKDKTQIRVAIGGSYRKLPTLSDSK